VLGITKWCGITIFSILNLRGATLWSLNNLKAYKKLAALRATKQQILHAADKQEAWKVRKLRHEVL